MNQFQTQTIETALQLRWLRAKRHLRSCSVSPRALREANRAASAPTRASLCRCSGGRIVALAA